MSQTTGRGTLADYIHLTRPFTLLAPTIGFLSGAAIAARGLPPGAAYIGAASAAILNAASNIINQYFDLEIDRINKPKRPLPAGRISIRAAWIFTILLYIASFVTAALVNVQFLLIVVFTAVVTYAYSGPPFRTKRWGILANLTIALPRGCLLMVAGWTSVRPDTMWTAEPWFIGMIFGLYVAGAATTKDFSDMKGDAQGGCRTLPIVYGVRNSAKIIAPFFVFPFLLMLVGPAIGVLEGSKTILTLSGIALSIWGVYIAYLILRRPEELTLEANHVSWKHMYLMLVAGQVAFALAYIVGPS
jgi:geranylgeranylglycerol-phosphate geranylgeranyltransferase